MQNNRLSENPFSTKELFGVAAAKYDDDKGYELNCSYGEFHFEIWHTMDALRLYGHNAYFVLDESDNAKLLVALEKGGTFKSNLETLEVRAEHKHVWMRFSNPLESEVATIRREDLQPLVRALEIVISNFAR